MVICLRLRLAVKRIMLDNLRMGAYLDQVIVGYPELFPASISQGYTLRGQLSESKKLPGIRLRQIMTKSGAFTLRPSFLFLYMMGTADEHHLDWCGQKGFLAMTAAGGCTLGAALTQAADEKHLTEAYGVVRREAHNLAPDWQPQTANTDGWKATRAAFAGLFPTVVLILCFLHGFLKIRDRCRRLCSSGLLSHEQSGGSSDEPHLPISVRQSGTARRSGIVRTTAAWSVPAQQLPPLRSTPQLRPRISFTRPTTQPSNLPQKLAPQPPRVRFTSRVQAPNIESGRVRELESCKTQDSRFH